jgi:hypothetical protein
MNPILVEEGVELLLEIGLAIMKSVRGKETTQTTLKRVHAIIEAKLMIDADVDATARGLKL